MYFQHRHKLSFPLVRACRSQCWQSSRRAFLRTVHGSNPLGGCRARRVAFRALFPRPANAPSLTRFDAHCGMHSPPMGAPDAPVVMRGPLGYSPRIPPTEPTQMCSWGTHARLFVVLSVHQRNERKTPLHMVGKEVCGHSHARSTGLRGLLRV